MATISLLLTLSAIALVDSMSMVPLALIPMTLALGSERPWSSSAGFLSGIVLTYFLCGVVILAGAEFVLEKIGPYFERLWNQPNALELALQIVIGLLLLGSAWVSWRSAKPKETPRPAMMTSPGALFMIGASLVLLGIPGAVPYLAGIERIVRYDPDWMGAARLLAFYNLVFVLPFFLLIGLRVFLPNQAGRVFKWVADFAMGVMPRLITLLLFAAGMVIIADGIGWFFGHPILPVSSAPEAQAI